MQVKKFEAKTMKEALELVKVHMGPEAIILSAKDSHRGFGLMGEKSVEVTAAVTDETLRRKKMAESKLRDELRERFQQIPASKQKAFINKVFHNNENERRELAMAEAKGYGTPVSSESRAQAKGMRYIDIADEEKIEARMTAQDRVKHAAERARMASREVFQEPQPKRRSTPGATKPSAMAQAQARSYAQPPPSNSIVTQNSVREFASSGMGQEMVANYHQAQQTQSSTELRSLESQVRELKSLVERFQQMPQMNMSMHPGAEQGLSFELSAAYQRLTGQGIHSALVTNMLKRAQKEIDADSIKKPSMVDAWLVRQLLNTFEVSQTPTQGRYHVFMGSTGQGKTSSLIKFASHLVMKEKKKIAIISLDTVKVGAADQLRIYAQVLNVPFAIVRNPQEWQVAQQKLSNVQHILVDAPGLTLSSMEEAEWLKTMLPPAEFDRRLHYVQSILARDEEAIDLASRYQMIGFHDVIFTRLDESARQGLLLNFQERFRTPIHSFGTGSRIPEDFEFATKERIVDFIFKLSRLSKREEAL